MYRRSVFPFLAIVLALLGGPARGATVTLGTTADAFVTGGSADPNAGLPTNNFGGAGALMVSGAGTTKGEMQTFLKFSLASAKASFDATYGAGNWIVNGVTLQLGTNFGTAGAQPNNPIFNAVTAGFFKVDWLANDNWGEGTGNPGAPFVPGNPPIDGVTFASLNLLLGASDQLVGSFNYTPVGNTSPPTVPAATYALSLGLGLLGDISAGGDLSLRAYPGDDSVGYLFNARSFGTVANRPVLIVSAIPEPGTGALLAGPALLWIARRRRHARAI